MDFTGIGKIGNFVKQKNLIFAANYRIKTGQRLTDGNGTINFARATIFSQSQATKSSSTSAADAARLAIIKQKLRSGKKLSGAEMSYLRENDSKLYRKAKYAEETREELKSALKEAKTKQEAREAVMHAMAKVAADCSADFESLQGSAGGGASFGGNVNLGGDNPISGGENMNVEGGENLSVDNPNFANSENVSAENSVAQGSADEDSDSAFDILDKYIYAIRAIQNEWLEFIKSDKYKNMPEDIFEAADILVHGGKKNKISTAQTADAILAYRAAMDYGQEL